MKKHIAIIVAVLALTPVWAFAQSVHFKAADESVAFRVYNGYSSALTITVTNGGAENDITFSNSEATNTVDGSGNTDTVGELQAAIVALTNGWTGGARLIVDSSTSLTNDSTDGELLNGTYTAAASNWVDVLWDTSACKFYQVSFPSVPVFDHNGDEIKKSQRSPVAFTIDRVYGYPDGTGNVTLDIYVDGNLKYRNVTISPTYALGVGDSGTNVTVDAVTIDVSPGIPVGSQDSAIVRATRATTATTGNIGVIAKQ